MVDPNPNVSPCLAYVHSWANIEIRLCSEFGVNYIIQIPPGHPRCRAWLQQILRNWIHYIAYQEIFMGRECKSYNTCLSGWMPALPSWTGFDIPPNEPADCFTLPNLPHWLTTP